MKRIIYFLLLGITIAMTFLIYKQIVFENTEVTNEEVKEEEIEFKMSGYYYFGYLDEREKQDSKFEKDYFHNMDNHFQDYYNNMFIMSKEDKELEEEYIKYFESIGGLSLYSMPGTGLKLKNGDYITFIVKSPIKESYPAMIEKIENVEVLHPRVFEVKK